ncbi:NB-ARC domain-containing protein [[Actinomadura] parvosata]|uniref:NB-ARC domain-containing protein n=1 Tax=[Actinomadura] parvosata TaxID=1955412 RepID=UPI00406CFAD0
MGTHTWPGPPAPHPAATEPDGPLDPPPPRQPPSIPGELFVGRAAELGVLTEALSPTGLPAGTKTALIWGPGGVGKTWLALRWAHRNAESFPDGLLHLDLRGHDPVTPPVTAEEAVRDLLLALGADPRTIPPAPEAQAALYRDMMAGRRMLVLIDDAPSTRHVQALLPGTSTSAVLITSRRELDLPAAARIPLGGLSEQEASRLLVRAIGTTRPHAVRDLLRRCAGLPLALGLVAARLATRPHLPVETPTAATALVSEPLAEQDAALRAAFEASWLGLGEDARRLLLALAPAPVPDVGLAAAASLAALPAARTRTLLRLLEAAHLVIEHRPGRFRMHDLVRLHTLRQAGPASTAAALRRLVDHYMYTAHHGAITLAPQARPITMSQAPGVHPALPATGQDALDWFDTERDCLLTLLRWTAEQDWNEDAWRIAWSVDEMLRRGGHVHDRVRVWESAVFAAERLGAADVQCLAYRRLAHAHDEAGDHAAALPARHRALALAAHLRDRRGQAQTHRTSAFPPRAGAQAARVPSDAPPARPGARRRLG